MAGRLKKGARCSSACVTKDHRTFGECMRSKRLNLNPNLSETQLQKSWDRELDAYRDAVRQGVQPAGTKLSQTRKAMEISDSTGVAYRGA